MNRSTSVINMLAASTKPARIGKDLKFRSYFKLAFFSILEDVNVAKVTMVMECTALIMTSAKHFSCDQLIKWSSIVKKTTRYPTRPVSLYYF